MEKVLEGKREQDNLLDRFIRNEKTSKLWAILSVLAFCGVSTTVLTVAYKMKNSSDHIPVTDSVLVTKTDTVTVTKTDTVFKTINDSEAINKIEEFGQTINGLEAIHTRDSLEIIKLNVLLKQCGQKAPQQKVSVIVHTYNIRDSAILPTVIGNIINNRVYMMYDNPVYLRSVAPFTGIVYYDQRFATQANSFKDALNSSPTFEPILNLQVKYMDPASNKSKADIEIWLNYRSLTKKRM